MKYQTNTFYTTITGGSIASIAFLLGGIDNLVIALVLFMIVDFSTGVAAGWGENKTSSKRAFQGLIKKGAMLSLVIVANQLDVITGGDASFMRNAMIFFLLGTEGISITENMNRLGVKFPSFLTQRFEQMVNKTDEKGETNDKNSGHS
ncbi:phage holin family protein [Anaerobacillus isosaccharinicus]|uniref:Holin n=1 Tax=Anaerobacillus isosaccharinicus TaxID=1532552 RepID=A0A1S2L9N1_9BACI|nr:phage holin family protein [Anaerobacillus isosaccharinicus]MBA5584590.1 phage holin family protein [Anaerobacillus isosaccharinicus]QOY37030.1 phage holin family protein [Anaerobacillus isosaccharinicus]